MDDCKGLRTTSGTWNYCIKCFIDKYVLGCVAPTWPENVPVNNGVSQSSRGREGHTNSSDGQTMV